MNEERLKMANKFEVTSKVKSTHYDISIWDDIEDFEDYDDLFKALSKIGKNDSLTLKVSTPGGRCDIGFAIYEKIHNLDCRVNVIVPYPTYSMGAIIALCGDSLKVEPGAFLMFHDYSTGTRGKGNEIAKSAEAYGECFAYRFNKICQPFLTKKECSIILNGQDLYVKWDDDNLAKRIERHFK